MVAWPRTEGISSAADPRPGRAKIANSFVSLETRNCLDCYAFAGSGGIPEPNPFAEFLDMTKPLLLWSVEGVKAT
jgi:hypothetical protein